MQRVRRAINTHSLPDFAPNHYKFTLLTTSVGDARRRHLTMQRGEPRSWYAQHKERQRRAAMGYMTSGRRVIEKWQDVRKLMSRGSMFPNRRNRTRRTGRVVACNPDAEWRRSSRATWLGCTQVTRECHIPWLRKVPCNPPGLHASFCVASNYQCATPELSTAPKRPDSRTSS